MNLVQRLAHWRRPMVENEALNPAARSTEPWYPWALAGQRHVWRTRGPTEPLLSPTLSLYPRVRTCRLRGTILISVENADHVDCYVQA